MRISKCPIQSVIVALLGAALSLPVAAQTTATTLTWSLATGPEVIHKSNNKYLELAIQSQRATWMNWKLSLGTWNSRANICGSALVGKRYRWRAELGMCYGAHDPAVTSRGKYKTGIWYRWRDDMALGFIHYSCNRDLTRRLTGLDIIPRCSLGARNRGLNFLVLEFRR